MLISCFQCRQQLDVPEDSAGRRVRCPHCQYVIVVPAKAKAETNGVPAAAVALPSMDLDDSEKPATTTKVSPQPLPPVYDVPPHAEPSKPAPKSEPPVEDLPPMPSIERGKGRRRPMSPLPTQTNWRKVVGIGIVVGVVVIGVVALAAFSSRQNRIRPQQPPQVMFQPQRPPMQMVPNQNFGRPNMMGNLPMQVENWRNFEYADHRFRASFPDQPVQNERIIREKNPVGVTSFFVHQQQQQQLDWEFTVAHRKLAAKEYAAIAPDERFAQLHDVMSNLAVVPLMPAAAQPVPDTHEGREWTIRDGNRVLFLRTYLAREGASYHHYLVMVRAPGHIQRADVKVNRFFNDFTLLIEDGTRLYEELDAVNGARRDNEYTALAIHPTEAITVTGSVASTVRIFRGAKAPNGDNQPADRPVLDIQHNVQDGKPIDQVAISHDGRWLAAARAGQIQYWRDWAEGELNKTTVLGSRCTFTKKHNLLVTAAEGIKEYALDPHALVATLPIPDFAIKGFALSSDDNTLAIFGDNAIELWQRREKKRLGRIAAHDAAVTAVAFAPDGKTLASASADRTVKLWKVDDLAPRATLNQHAWGVWSLAFTPDGKYLASGGLDGMLLVWDLTAPMPGLVWAKSHQFPVRAIAFDADKNLYLTCKHPASNAPGGGKQYTRQVRKLAWADIKLDSAVAVRNVAQQAGMHLPTCSPMASQSPDGQTYLSGMDTMDLQDSRNSLRVWDTATASLKYARDMKFNGVPSPDGKWFAFAKPGLQNQNQMQLLEVQTGRVIDSLFLPDNTFPVVSFTPDSKSLWVRRPNELARYDFQKDGGPPLVQKKVVEVKKPNDPGHVFVHVSADRKTFLIETTSPEGLVQRKLCSTKDGTPLMPRGALVPNEPNQYLRLRPVGRRVEVEDFLNGTSHVLGQQRMPMITHAIDPQRKYAATTQFAADQTVRVNLWDLQARRPLLTLPDLRSRSASAVRFSPDGQQLVLVTDAYTRIVPVDWLLERQAFLQSNEVAAP